MFEFLKKKTNKELEEIIKLLEANKSNNYKDNAQANFKDLRSKYEEMIQQGVLSTAQTDYYANVIAQYEKTMQGYTHKDQTPYWTPDK